MKKTQKILVLAVVLAVVFATLVFAISAETDVSYTGNVADATAKLQVSIDATNAETKKQALDELSIYMKDHPIDPKSDGYSELENGILNESYECGKLYLAKINVADGTARCAIAINKLKATMKAHPFSTHPEYQAFAESYAGKLKEQENAILAKRKELDEKNSIDEYEYQPEFNFNFDDGKTTGIDIGNHMGTDETGKKKENFVGIEGTDENKYYSVKYQHLKGNEPDSSGLHTFITWKLAGGERGMVFDFDFTTFGELPKQGLRLESGEDSNAGNRIFPAFVLISKDGHVQTRSGDILLDNAIVKGEWLHFTVVFHPDTFMSDVYVEYELLGSFDCRGGNDKRTFTISSPRMGQKNYEGEFSVDNFMIYPGTGVRTLDRFEKMSNDEKFITYTEYMANGRRSVKSRKVAYDYAKSLVVDYYDSEKKEYKTDKAELISAVDKYLAFDYEKLVKNYSDSNLAIFASKINSLSLITRAERTYNDRKIAVIDIDAFLEKNADFITRNDEYTENITALNIIKNNLSEEEKMMKFNKLMERFKTATTIVSMTKYYDQASAIVKEGLETGLVGSNEFASFTKAYNLYNEAGEALEVKILDENARKFVVCINLIKEYDTVDEWVANHDYVEKYILIARKMVYEGRYNPSYEGFNDAFDIYRSINSYFYEELQQEHIKEIKTELEKYEKTDKYIEKMGICSYIDVYVENNDIDSENAEIAELLQKHQANKDNLHTEEEKYANALRENTAEFIKLVETLKNCKGYKDIKAVYDKAELLYYAMNVGNEETKNAIKTFDEYTVLLEKVEMASEKFIECVALMKNAKDEKLFTMLVEACTYRKDVSEEYDGISNTLAEFEKINDKYMSFVNSINEEVKATVDLAGSLRTR